MKFNGGTLPDPDILSILQIRKVLTALALELAIPRITDEEIQQLFTCSAQFDKTNDCVRQLNLFSILTICLAVFPATHCYP